MIIQVSDGYKSFAAKDIFDGLDFMVSGKEKIALIGRNGVGKTTLFRILTGQEMLDKGNVFKQNKVTIGYLEQHAFQNEAITVREQFEKSFAPIRALEKQLQTLSEQMKVDDSPLLLEKFARLQENYERQGGYTYEVELMTLVTRFGFSEAELDRKIESFSGGQKTRLAFIQMLMSKPDVLLLDEPTNHLDLQTIEWLEGYLHSYDRALVVVSHDRLFLDRVCDHVCELEHQKAYSYTGNYTSFLRQKEENLARQETLYHNQQKEIARLEALIEKFRFKASKAAFAQSKIKYLDRLERIDPVQKDAKPFKAHFSSRLRGGKVVFECTNLAIGYDHVLSTLNLEILRGERIGVIGANGIGKSTLLKTIVGLIPALGGEMLLGHQIEIGYFDQVLGQFNPQKSVLEELWDDYPSLDKTQVRSVLGQFLFTGDDVFKLVAVLSGGEKVRLALAKLMLRRANFLVLDEPTNHLDIPAKEALEEALSDYDGTLLFVSHDRYFIEKCSTALLIFSPEGVEFQRVSERITLDEVMNDPSVKVKKEERKSDYTNKKQLQRDIANVEKKLEEQANVLAEKRSLRFDPEYYHDYQKMAGLDDEIDEVHNTISHLEKQWEDLQIKLEAQEE